MSKIYRFFLIMILIISVGISTLPAYAVQPDDSFYDKVSDLISEQDSSSYFGEMKMTIGSSILTIDDKTQEMDTTPEIQNSRTMLPIRAVAEAAGAEVGWEQSTQTVTISSSYGDEISLTIGSDTITVNDETSELDVEPYIKNGRTYLPVRAVSEALDFNVEWDANTSTVSLTAPYQTSRLLVMTEELDVNEFNPETALYNDRGMWVLQFSSPSEAKAADELLQSLGYISEPDTCLFFTEPEVVATGTGSSDTNHYSWGVEDCKFDLFIRRYSNLFSRTGIVAVVDTGVDANHPLLKGRVQTGCSTADKGTSNDISGHGTHVAGTIIDCVSSAPVQILPIRAYCVSSVDPAKLIGTDSTLANGIIYAADHGADVINSSNCLITADGTESGAESACLDYAIKYAINKGCLFINAAGNDSVNTYNVCPAHITVPGMVVVSAGDRNHKRAYFSNYGQSVDLMAPGVSIISSFPGGGYATESGTSMAAPHAAAAAILLDLAWGKSLSPSELEGKLRSATTYGTWTNQDMGCGFLNLEKAPVPDSITPVVHLSQSNLSLSVGEAKTITAVTTPSGQPIAWKSSDVSVASVNGNGVISAHKSGSATITATMIYNESSISASCTVMVNEPTPSLQAPALHITSDTITEGDISYVLWDDISGAVEYDVFINGSKVASTVYEFYELLDFSVGTYSIQVRAKDGNAHSPLSNTVTLTVQSKKETETPAPMPVTVSFSVNTDRQSVGITNATLANRVTVTGTSTTNVSEYGMTLYDSNGNQLAARSDTPSNISGKNSYFDLWYDVNTRLSYTLKTQTTYKYQFYCVIDGITYYGSTYSFTTAAEPTTRVPEDNRKTSTGVVIGTSSGALAINDAPASSPNSSNQIGRIPEGKSCTVYTDLTSGNWYWVEYNGVQGYAYKTYIKLLSESKTRTGIVNGTSSGALAINDAPASSPKNSNQIGRIPEGKSCIVYTDLTSGNWYWVEYNGVQGYAYSGYIKLQ